MSAREAAAIGPLIGFAAAMARGRHDRARRALAAARRSGIRRVAAEEVALMLVLHAGYPAALEAAAVLLDAWPGVARGRDGGGPREWTERGERLCARVYGAAYAKLRSNVARLHPDLAAWMIEQGYGRVLTRPGLSGPARELIAVTVLAAGGWERQLVSHLLGAARLGAAPADIRRACRAGIAGGGAGARGAATRAWRKAFGSDAAGGRGRGVRE
jgi:4-carboxymuconolactone decarboxylase